MINEILDLEAYITNLDWDGDFITCNRMTIVSKIDAIKKACDGAKTLSKTDVISAVCFCAEEIEIATRVKCRTHGQYEIVEKQTDL